MDVKELQVLHSGEQFPITEYQSPELLLDVRHLWLRSQRMRTIMRLRSYTFKYLREFLDKQKFYEITPPLLTISGGETGANLFEVEYFDKKVYLTESSQLYSEAMVYALDKVYTLAPTYRAEKSRTIKHLAEFWMLGARDGILQQQDEHEAAVAAGEPCRKQACKEGRGPAQDVERGHGSLLMKIRPPFKTMTYEKAIEKLNELGSKKKWGDDFGVEEEQLLTMEEEKPIFVYNWPKEIKAFYMPVNKGRSDDCCMRRHARAKGPRRDSRGSERIWKEDELVERMKELNFNIENYKWYIDLRKYGSVPHAGFGLGCGETNQMDAEPGPHKGCDTLPENDKQDITIGGFMQNIITDIYTLVFRHTLGIRGCGIPCPYIQEEAAAEHNTCGRDDCHVFLLYRLIGVAGSATTTTCFRLISCIAIISTIIAIFYISKPYIFIGLTVLLVAGFMIFARNYPGNTSFAGMFAIGTIYGLLYREFVMRPEERSTERSREDEEKGDKQGRDTDSPGDSAGRWGLFFSRISTSVSIIFASDSARIHDQQPACEPEAQPGIQERRSTLRGRMSRTDRAQHILPQARHWSWVSRTART